MITAPPTRKHLLLSAIKFLQLQDFNSSILHILDQMNIIALQNNYKLYTLEEIEKYLSLT
jgi:hypothetical protein